MSAIVTLYACLVVAGTVAGLAIGYWWGREDAAVPPPARWRAPESNPLPDDPGIPFELLLMPPAAAAERLADTGELVRLYGRDYPPGPPGGEG